MERVPFKKVAALPHFLPFFPSSPRRGWYVRPPSFLFFPGSWLAAEGTPPEGPLSQVLGFCHRRMCLYPESLAFFLSEETMPNEDTTLPGWCNLSFLLVKHEAECFTAPHTWTCAVPCRPSVETFFGWATLMWSRIRLSQNCGDHTFSLLSQANKNFKANKIQRKPIKIWSPPLCITLLRVTYGGSCQVWNEMNEGTKAGRNSGQPWRFHGEVKLQQNQ